VPFGTAGPVAATVGALAHDGLEEFGSVGLAGDSAGGQIALSVAQRLRDEGVSLSATVLISPALDLSWSNPRIPDVQPTDPWLGVPGARILADLWRGGLDIDDPIVSPLFGEFAGLAPLTIFSGSRDILNPDAHLLVAKAKDAGVRVDFTEVPGELHVYPLLPTKVGADARRAIVAALRQ
jgi:acetyl esterase/lipase